MPYKFRVGHKVRFVKDVHLTLGTVRRGRIGMIVKPSLGLSGGEYVVELRDKTRLVVYTKEIELVKSHG